MGNFQLPYKKKLCMTKKIKFGSKITKNNGYLVTVWVITRVELTDDNILHVFGCKENFFESNKNNVQKLYDNDHLIETFKHQK